MRLNKKGDFLWIAIVMGLAWGGPSPSMAAVKEDMAPGRAMARQAMKKKASWITADHSKHEILTQDFKSGPQVTAACLSCHNQAALQFHQTLHWTWKKETPEGGKTDLGKGGLSINNF